MNPIRSLFSRLTVLFGTMHVPLDDRYAHTHAYTHVPRGESMDESIR
ncbi:protein of unknown function [Pararobbsia alpina]|jgi:hypothetical protein